MELTTSNKTHPTHPPPSPPLYPKHVDGYKVVVDPTIPSSEAVISSSGSHLTVRSLNLNSVSVISTVMGQTVALDYYYVVVDNMLSSFEDLNSTVEKTGTFSAMEKEVRKTWWGGFGKGYFLGGRGVLHNNTQKKTLLNIEHPPSPSPLIHVRVLLIEVVQNSG